jgi:two-component system sensor histidine kinase VicK
MTATTQSEADQRWRTAVLAIGGLLIAIAVIGVVGILINRNIHQTVDDAISHDVELADSSGDLRVAILEVRHYHRDLLLNNPDPTRVELWQERYRALIGEIDTVESAIDRHPDRDALPDVAELRSMATAYFEDFASAVQDDIDDPTEFRDLATSLLVPLESMEAAAVAIDRAGEERAAAAFADIDDASNTGTLVLLAVIIGLGAMGGVLAVAVLRLVQEQRRLVTVEQAVVAQMAETSRAKTDFIADASHELRTPLTVLRGNAEVGLAIDADCAHREILTEIVEESARMSRLVDDLLFLARSDASSVPLDMRETDVGQLMQALAGRAEVLARERGATMESRVTADGRVRADPGRIEQAVLILVDNAAKYGPEGGLVELDASMKGGRLVIEVLDRGPGIPVEQQGRIFERFYRVDGAERGRSTGGVGLGLSIAAAIVEGHGGHIAATRRAGGGTTMVVTLPLRPDDVVGEGG